ncbi:hypothetical protein Tco_0512544 [Tanacetum coccineum]
MALHIVKIDDPNITIEEYIRLEKEKSRRRGKVYNWENATYGKIWYDEDVHDLISVETEFLVIFYNDALTSEVALSCEPTVSPRNNNQIDFRISFDESDDEDYTVSLYDVSRIPEIDMALPPRDQRYTFLKFEGLEYTDVDIADFEERLGKIYGRGVHWLQVFDFGGLTAEMVEGLSGRMLMDHRDAQGQSVFTSRAWRWLFKIRGPLVHELILEFFNTFRFGETVLDLDTVGALQFQLDGAKRRMSWREFILAMGLQIAEEMRFARFRTYWAKSARQIPKKGDLSAYWRGILFEGDFLGVDVDSVNIPYLYAWYLRRFALGRKRGAMISGGQFICNELDDTWAWVASGPERQPDAAAGAPEVAEGDSDVDEGTQAVLEPQRDVLDSMARAFSRFTTWTVTSLSLMMDQSGIRIPEIGLHGFPIFCTGPRWKEIDNVGEVLII